MHLLPLDPDRRLARSLAERHPPSRRSRVLALAADLADDLDATDLDAVDGEFFWRCCRADLLEAVEALAAGRPRPIGASTPRGDGTSHDDDVLDARVAPMGVFDHLRDGLRFVGDFLALADEAARLYPGVVWRRLLDGERVAMRAAEAEVRDPGGGGGPGDGARLHLRVFSGAWTGAQVEDELRRLAEARARRFVAALGPALGEVAVRFAFSLVDAGRDPDGTPEDGRPRPPYVEVVAPFPLPPAGVVAREYDALVRGDRRWHLGLPGGGSRQEKEVALRTWAVGLLVAAGEPFGDAMHTVAAKAGLAEVTQTRFGQDRLRLVERVPEAEAYVFAPRARAEPDARADAPRALANPAGPPPPLQPPAPEEGAYT